MYQKSVEFSSQPPLFSIQARPDGMAVITLYDNIICNTDTGEQRWHADMHVLAVPYTHGLDKRVAANYAVWITKARAEAAEKAAREAAKISDKDRFAQIESAIMELAELSAGGDI